MFDLGRNSVVDSPESTDDGLGEPIIRGQLLHEMQLVDILDTTFSLYRSDFWLFIGIAAVLHIPFGIIWVLIVTFLRIFTYDVGGLGLIVRQHRFPAEAEVKVYPNLLEVRKYELLIRRGMLHAIGLKNSRYFGDGTAIERLREYHPDDDFRRIDWKATSRWYKPIVREFETERNQEIIIMLDTGRLMASPIRNLIKLGYAINTSLMASYVCTLKSDKVGLIAFSDTVQQYLPPKPGKKQLHTMLELLYNVQVQWVEHSFERAFAYLASTQKNVR